MAYRTSTLLRILLLRRWTPVRFVPYRALPLLFGLLSFGSLGLSVEAEVRRDWRRPTPSISDWISQSTTADFDGDGLPDVATLKYYGHGAIGYLYRLDLQLARKPETTLFFMESRWALTIASLDVDGDADQDIVIRWQNQAVGVWINDGRGGFASHDVSAYRHQSDAAGSEASRQKSINPDPKFVCPDRGSSVCPAVGLIAPKLDSKLSRSRQTSFVASRDIGGRRQSRAPPSV